jgi:hypothetical protein
MFNMNTMKFKGRTLPLKRDITPDSGKGGKHSRRIRPAGDSGKKNRFRRAAVQNIGNGIFKN